MKEIGIAQFKWIDVADPTKEMLEELADKLKLPRKVLYNCLDSDYLPHSESYGSTHFILMRLLEPDSKITASSLQELTTKIAVFLNDEYFVTVHRLNLVEVDFLNKKIKSCNPAEATKEKMLSILFEQVSLGFDQPLNELEKKFETFEEIIFNSRSHKSLIQEGFYIKRKASAFKKVLKLSIDLLTKTVAKLNMNAEVFQGAKDRLERDLFYAEEVSEGIQSLVNLHFSVQAQKTNEASFKTNETMRVLTVLSIFFLPLNFLAGVFGMNFEHIPLLDHPLGFWISLIMMLCVSLFLAFYVVKQGWIVKPDFKKNNTAI